MPGRLKSILVTLLLGAALIVAWMIALGAGPPHDFEALQAAQSGGSGVLDGKRFAGKAGIVGKPLDIADEWHFDKGTFVSTECETRCRYPRAPYYSRVQSGALEFMGETHCLDKDARITWKGTVDGEKISGTFTWHISRWYWTVEKSFWFEGTLMEPPNETATQ